MEPPLGLDTLCLISCLLFYSLKLITYTYYAFKVDLLFSIMLIKTAQKGKSVTKNKSSNYVLLYCNMTETEI